MIDIRERDQWRMCARGSQKQFNAIVTRVDDDLVWLADPPGTPSYRKLGYRICKRSNYDFLELRHRSK